MDILTIIGIVALTSSGAFVIGTRSLGLNRRALGLAVGEALECVGLAVVFLVVNVLAGVVLILGLRALTGRFISIYWLNDVSLAVLSLLQALAFHCWRRTKR